MSLKRTFEDEVEFQLAEAKLPLDIELVIGRRFRLGCTQGSHHHIFVGTIEGFSITDEGGFELQISNRCFWGAPLIGLYWNPDAIAWQVHIDVSDPAMRYHKCEFILL